MSPRRAWWILPALTAAALPAVSARADPPARDGGAPAAFVLSPAAVLDPAPFSHAQPLRVLSSAAGVSRVRLSAGVLSVARDDLADVRVVDGASRQWPFVIAPDTGHEALDLHMAQDSAERGVSTWRLTPRVSPAVIDGITLRIDREVFDRSFRLLGEPSGGHGVQLTGGRLKRGAGGSTRDTAEVSVPLSTVRVADLTLMVDDGDEAPLPLVAAHAEARTAELRLLAPAGQYTVLAGDPDARAPRYEIAGAREQILAAPADWAEPGKLGPNPAHRPRLPGGEARDQYALWVVLGLAVAALGALTLRLARREKVGEGKVPSGGGAGAEPPSKKPEE
jgi:hypothetical protein